VGSSESGAAEHCYGRRRLAPQSLVPCKGSQRRLCFVAAFAYAEHMTIRVTDVHLANVPAMLVGECGGHALSVDFVDVVHPNRHPHAVIGLLRLASFRNVVVLGP
jgi:hypothetical protein